MDRPTHATIVKGFHKYTRAAKSPEGRNSGKMKILSKGMKTNFKKDPHPEGTIIANILFPSQQFNQTHFLFLERVLDIKVSCFLSSKHETDTAFIIHLFTDTTQTCNFIHKFQLCR